MNTIWEGIGFIRWPLTFTVLIVALLTLTSGYRLFRPAAWPDLRTKAFVDAILFWGGFAVVTGMLGTLVGIIIAAQAIEAAGAVVMGGPIGRTAAYLFNGVARFFFMKGLARRPDREVLRMYLAPFRRRRDRKQTAISPRLLIKAAAYLQEVEAGLGKLRDRPVLLPWGTKDFAFQEAARVRFEGLFPNHRTVLLEASHFWQEDAGEEAADAIHEWMGS